MSRLFTCFGLPPDYSQADQIRAFKNSTSICNRDLHLIHVLDIRYDISKLHSHYCLVLLHVGDAEESQSRAFVDHVYRPHSSLPPLYKQCITSFLHLSSIILIAHNNLEVSQYISCLRELSALGSLKPPAAHRAQQDYPPLPLAPTVG